MRCAVLVLLAALGLLCVQIQATPYSGTPAVIPGKIEAEVRTAALLKFITLLLRALHYADASVVAARIVALFEVSR